MVGLYRTLPMLLLLSGCLLSPRQPAATGSPVVGGCPMFPAGNILNTPVDKLPVSPSSDDYVDSIGAGETVHADFGSGLWEGGRIGIPYVVVPQGQPPVPISFEYDDESDPGPYPIPPDPPIEGGPASDGDRHILAVEQGVCRLYETWSTYPEDNGSWRAGSGATWDLRSNTLRPDTWTSADAAGLPILPLLVRRDEVAAGVIPHALRFTAGTIRKQHVWPARHHVLDNTSPLAPPMGQRFRLKASFDSSAFSPEAQVILTALKTYGMLLADVGGDWFISGVPDEGWDNDVLRELGRVRGSDFEAVETTSLMLDPNSGEAIVIIRNREGRTAQPVATR